MLMRHNETAILRIITGDYEKNIDLDFGGTQYSITDVKEDAAEKDIEIFVKSYWIWKEWIPHIFFMATKAKDGIAIYVYLAWT